MSGKEVDGQTVQVAAVDEEQSVAEAKSSETAKETERSPSEERSRSRTNSVSSVASGDEEKKNGSIDDTERSGIATNVADSNKKNGEESVGSTATVNNKNNRKRTSGANEDGEKNGDDSEASNDTPELKKKKSDADEVGFFASCNNSIFMNV
ncbi:hypothetical protein X798_02897 [Onchocerca flexuosa]|uniref:Uncharacterized protein n=1 Tax=Onchocerca flexuosa TaxID=387005 RepID=A0A238BXS4_9BILA|nr:hypothetical protein X798_02897 [Onchocerca flexuosa]